MFAVIARVNILGAVNVTPEVAKLFAILSGSCMLSMIGSLFALGLTSVNGDYRHYFKTN